MVSCKCLILTNRPDGGEVELWAARDYRGGACSSSKRKTTGQMAAKVSLWPSQADVVFLMLILCWLLYEITLLVLH